jgi:ferredoxin-thioredoxin reductase catalytic subunit
MWNSFLNLWRHDQTQKNILQLQYSILTKNYSIEENIEKLKKTIEGMKRKKLISLARQCGIPVSRQTDERSIKRRLVQELDHWIWNPKKGTLRPKSLHIEVDDILPNDMLKIDDVYTPSKIYEDALSANIQTLFSTEGLFASLKDLCSFYNKTVKQFPCLKCKSTSQTYIMVRTQTMYSLASLKQVMLKLMESMRNAKREYGIAICYGAAILLVMNEFGNFYLGPCVRWKDECERLKVCLNLLVYIVMDKNRRVLLKKMREKYLNSLNENHFVDVCIKFL